MERDVRSQAALTYVWGMADAIYDIHSHRGSSLRYVELTDEALAFSRWFENQTIDIGCIRFAYSEWKKLPKVSLVKVPANQ